jgi:C1A family cysteine protease
MAIETPPQTIVDTSQDATLSRKSSNTTVLNTRFPSSLMTKIIKDYAPKKFHWVRDRPDARDFLYAPRPVAPQSKVDLRSLCTIIEDQGNLGSCTGNAIAGAIEYLNKKSGRTTDVSRLFIYYFEREMIGTVNYDSGAYIRDGIKTVFKYGAPLERLWPYIINRFTLKPTTTALTDGSKRKVTLYEKITDFAGCKNALANGFPVIIGFDVYSSFVSSTVSRTGMMPYPNVNREVLLGGHAVLLVGYDDSTQRFIVRNSWGTRWGDRGYFYMPYQVIQNTSMSDDFWIIKTVNNPI